MSLLPNFCSGGNSSDRNNWDANANKYKDLKSRDNTGKYKDLNSRRLNDYDRNNFNSNKYGYKHLGNIDPNAGLLGPMRPPGGANTHYSNSGASGRYRDMKRLYTKEVIKSANLGIGIILAMYIIAKKLE